MQGSDEGGAPSVGRPSSTTAGGEARPGVTSAPGASGRGMEGGQTGPDLQARQVVATAREAGAPGRQAIGEVPKDAGYPTARGEVLGYIPRDQLPTATGDAAYGREIEPSAVAVLRERFPETEFSLRIGPGGKGPDVTWVGGKDPGFNIADIKPDSDSGWAKFFDQVRQWEGGPTAAPDGSFRAAMIVYDRADGSVSVVEVGHVGGKGP
jgi:hypothetical protein